MATRYDLIVIGTGTAASTAAHQCRAGGFRVAVIDHLPFGGTCVLRGCDPKKVLVGAAEAVDQVRRLRGRGVGGGEPVIDWPELMGFKRSFTEPVPAQRAARFVRSGIDAFRGEARFTSPRTVAVDAATLEGRFILIATGAVPVPLGIPGEEFLTRSDRFLELERLPRRIAFVGGGYIAAEFAHIAARAGAQVTILQQGERMLPQFDGELVRLLEAKSRALGIEIRAGAKVEAIENGPDGLRAVIASARAGSAITADLMVHAAGRAPDIEPLDLAAGGVERQGHRLALNDFLQSTSNPAVYAAGDAAGRGPPLTPVAGYDGRIVATNMLHGNSDRVDYTAVPSVVYTIPALARVGLSEEEARHRNLSFRVRHESTSGWYTSRRVAEECAGFKVLIEEGTERILGAHLVGPDAAEVINLFALAMRMQMPAGQLTTVLMAYPTAGADIKYML
ncbi:MAG TPA: NAD(P)/FAD-dependent oxidoreductase [Steroidobacteraceae bacterium]|nr:NAD(P)/FAD-dependent oxidoreductase [Steroidobacteraceae bacterium]